MRCGADILIFVLFFFLIFKRLASSSVETTTLGTDLPEVVLLLREYGRGLFDSDNEMGDGSILMHKVHTHARILNSSTLLITSLIHQ